MKEKKWLVLQILEIPDLTLAKYNTSGMKGIDSLLEFHRIFLRQWYRKGVLADVSIHLFYQFSPDEKPGNKLGVFLGFYGCPESMQNTKALIESSSLLSVYSFRILQKEQYERIIGKQRYRKCCILTKKELVLKESSSDEGMYYYTVAEWQPNEEGRLRQLYALLNALNEKTAVRIDVYPENRREEIRNIFMDQSEKITKYQSGHETITRGRNYLSDMIIDSYNKIGKEVDSTPLFRTNIFAFGSKYRANGILPCDDVEMILDTMASESLEKGNYQIVQIENIPDEDFCGFSFLNEEIHGSIEKKYKAYDVADVHREKRFSQCHNSSGYELMDVRFEKKIIRFLPTLFSLEQLEPFFRLPIVDENDTIEIRKETAPKAVENGLFLGVDNWGHSVNFPLNLLVKHAFIAGVPGSGKTNLMHHLISSLWRKKKEKRIPFLVFEPAKKEYRALLNQEGMEDVFLFSPNAAMMFPIHVNPFEFPKGLMLSEHIRQLEEVFEGAFPLENPMPFLLDTAIEAVYKECGWEPDMVNDASLERKFPTMSMLYKRLEEELENTTYSDEVSGNLKSALQVRIGSLLRREMGKVFDVPLSTFSPEEWLDKAAIIELEAMGAGPANFMTLLLCALIRESLKVTPAYQNNSVRHVIFIEEAHNLIGPTAVAKYGDEADPKQAATAFIVKMLAEVRALKEGIVIADQLPTVMAPEIIKNTGLKIGLRITSADDRELLCSTMAANGVQMEGMGTYDVGKALVSYEGLKKPFEMQLHQWLGKGDDAYIEDDYLRSKIGTPKNDTELLELIRMRDNYQYMIRQNIRVEMKKFRIHIDEYKEKCEKTVNHLKKMAELKKAREYDEVAEMRKIVDTFGTDTELILKCEQNTEQYNRLLEEYEKDPAFVNKYSILEEGLKWVLKLENKVKSWNYMGNLFWEKYSDLAQSLKDFTLYIYTVMEQLYKISMPYYSDENRENADAVMKKIKKYM